MYSNIMHTEFYLKIAALIAISFLHLMAVSQISEDFLQPKSSSASYTYAGNPGHGIDFETNRESDIRNLTVEARATTAILTWDIYEDPPKGTVRGYNIYRRGHSETYESPVAFTGLEPQYIDSRLELSTTYSYRVTARFDSGEGGLSDEITITTLPNQNNLYTYANLKLAVLIYKNTNRGIISDEHIPRIKKGIELARLFIWRNSLLKLNLQITYIVIDDYKNFENFDDYWGSVQTTATHLKELGVINTQYDLIFRISLATNGYWSYGTLDLNLPGPPRRTGFAHAVWPCLSGARHPGDDPETHYDLIWVFLHEVQHTIDAIYDINGLPQMYHGDQPHIFPFAVGEHYHFQAMMFRVFDAYENLTHMWGGIYEAWDTGNYGFPDDESVVPIDEIRFGSDPAVRDTDGDGLSDRDEFLSGIYNGSDPNNINSNGNGIIDGNDPYPRYRVNTFIDYYTPGTGDPGESAMTLAIDSVSYTQVGFAPRVYLSYDNDSLYITLRLSGYCEYIDFRFDCEGDGMWYGRGNTEMRISPSQGHIVELRSLDASPEGREFSQSIGEWAGGMWDDHPQYKSHFGRRVFEPEWIKLNIRTNSPSETSLKLAIPKNDFAGLYLRPGNVIGLNIYYQRVNNDPMQWASAFDYYSYVNFILHDYDYTRFAGGSGTPTDPYLIGTPEHLLNIRDFYWAHFKQIADIDLGVAPWNSGIGWEPIGNENIKFTGSYDGNGFVISNLTIRRPEQKWIGLFGFTRGSEMTDLVIHNVNISGEIFVGGLVGKMENSTVSNCKVDGTISGNWNIGGLVGESTDMSIIQNSYTNVSVHCNNRNAGGLVGTHVWGSIVRDSYAVGTVNGSGSLGGLVGDHYNCSINNCFATGNISGSDLLGGLVGNNSGGSSIINSYSTGNVQGYSKVGGLVGWSIGNSAITNSYAIGKVQGNELPGGLLGVQDASSHTSYSYWDVNTSGLYSSAGGEGRTTTAMSYPYNTDTYIGWNFTEIWDNDSTYYVNNGYPFLRWQQIPAKPTFMLTLSVNPENSGTVTGDGLYEEGDSITVTVSPVEGYVFVNWTIADETVMDGDDPAGMTFTYIMPGYDVLLIAHFDPVPVEIPVLVSPDNGAIQIAVDTTLIWNECTHAQEYHLQLSGDPEFVTCVIDSSGITTTSIHIYGLESKTRYNWRVCATGTGGTSNWSTIWSFTTVDFSSVARRGDEIPAEFVLYQNFPNPFNAFTVIKYGLPKSSFVRLTVYNNLGQCVRNLVQEDLTEGYYEFSFDASGLPSGVYVYRIQAGDYMASKKLLLLK
jgi:hypothetical protein